MLLDVHAAVHKRVQMGARFPNLGDYRSGQWQSQGLMPQDVAIARLADQCALVADEGRRDVQFPGETVAGLIHASGGQGDADSAVEETLNCVRGAGNDSDPPCRGPCRPGQWQPIGTSIVAHSLRLRRVCVREMGKGSPISRAGDNALVFVGDGMPRP